MVIFPKAKINIGLRITGKRPDGFHDIETIFYPVCLCDAVEFVVPEPPITDDVLQITGILANQSPDNNLIMKAIRKIRETRNIPFLKIHLHKAIPVGAGLGGGSSDAAMLLKSLNRHFNLDMSDEKLKEISLQLGSDCPFFIDGVPAFATGRGELLTPVRPLQKGFHILLVNPGLYINTKEAYNSCTPKQPSTDLQELYSHDISEWKNLIVNDFEEFIFIKYPQIASTKKALYEMGALFSSMSGSGATVFGIFDRKPLIPESLRNQVIYSDILQ